MVTMKQVFVKRIGVRIFDLFSQLVDATIQMFDKCYAVDAILHSNAIIFHTAMLCCLA